MQLLGINTTGQLCSVSLLREVSREVDVLEINSKEKMNHLSNLIPMIDELSKIGSFSLNEIDYICVSEGPGSFTGIRIGVSTARAMAQALGIKTVSVPTLQAFALEIFEDENTEILSEDVKKVACPIFDARRNQIYGGAFILDKDDIDIELDEKPWFLDDFLNSLENLKEENKEFIFAGDGINTYRDKIEDWSAVNGFNVKFSSILQGGRGVVVLGRKLIEQGRTKDFEELKPNYMRKPESQLRLEEKRAKEKFKITDLREEHIDGIANLEKTIFDDPWSRDSIADEIRNQRALYKVVEKDGGVVGYCGMWIIEDEGYFCNVAIDSPFRNLGLAKDMLKALMVEGVKRGVREFTLEVRKSNEVAINLYKNLGFIEEGIRKNYYSNGEDAIIMWKRVRGRKKYEG